VRKIAVLTGKRGGFGAMKPLLRAINEDDELKLSLIVTDQHLNNRFGKTIQEVQQEFEVAAAVDMEQEGGSPRERAKALGTCLTKIPDVLFQVKPDILVLYGDRGEVLATAIAAIHLGIPIAHLQGGDVSGNVDELMRHAITKLSHLHFPSTRASANRIENLGEEKWRITVAGDNHVDPIVAGDYTAEDVLRDRYNISKGESPILILQHPETTRNRDHYHDMVVTLIPALKMNRRTLIVYPCSDHGYNEIIRAIEEYSEKPGVTVHQNIPAEDFWGLMAIAGVLIGNSSAGLIETPYFKLPAINVGARQAGREHAENVIHVDFDENQIEEALRTVLENPVFRESLNDIQLPFGDGYAWKRVLEVLKKVSINEHLINKRITY